jgi:hypothetical protein
MLATQSTFAILGVSVGLTAAACTHTPQAPPEPDPAQDRAPVTSDAQAAAVDPSCPTQGGQRDEALKGPCVTGAECRFSTPGGAANCKPGMTFITAVPNDWLCTCASAEWKCDVTAGGFGVVPCRGVDSGIP